MRARWLPTSGRVRAWLAAGGFALLAIGVGVTWFRPSVAGPDSPPRGEPPLYLEQTPLIHVRARSPGACLQRLSTYAVTGAMRRSKSLERLMASHRWLRLGEKLSGLGPLNQGAIGRWLRDSLLAGELTLSVFDGVEPEGLLTVRTSQAGQLERLLGESRLLFTSPAGTRRVWVTKHCDPPLCVMVLADHWAISTSKSLLTRFCHSYARAGSKPCRALGMPAPDRSPHVIDVSLDTARLAKAKWFRRYYVAALGPTQRARWQRWRVTLGSDRVLVRQDVEQGAAADSPARAVVDPFVHLAPAAAVAYEFQCATHPASSVKARVAQWLAQALGPDWTDAAVTDAACWTVPAVQAEGTGSAMVRVVAARFRDTPSARARLAKSRSAWAKAVDGTFRRSGPATLWSVPYRRQPRLIHRWCGDVLVVGSGALRPAQMVAQGPTRSLAQSLGRDRRVVGHTLVRWQRLAQCMQAEATAVRQVGGWHSCTADQWADVQLTELLAWAPTVPDIRQVSTVEAGRLSVLTTLRVTPVSARTDAPEHAAQARLAGPANRGSSQTRLGRRRESQGIY